ncbi:MAG TPA: dTMP kinase [Actinocrinis sp.]|nr:dTMP kinase [Actinocrinis sp.]
MVRARVRQIRQRATATAAVASVPEPVHRTGWFIAVEGGDGTGKSTQIKALAAWLRGRGFEVVDTREPGGTELGKQLREILLHRADLGGVGERTEALLFAADRAHHIETLVKPALARGAIVLTDRHVDSSIAYQSGGRGLPEDIITGLSTFAVDGQRPDLTILLDLEPDLALDRAAQRLGRGGRQGDGPDRLESQPPEFHERVRAVFNARAEADPKHYLVIDASEPASVITGICKDRLSVMLPPSPREAADEADRQRALAAAEAAEHQRLLARAATERAAAEQAAREAAEREQAQTEAEEAERRARREGEAARAAAEQAAAEAARREEQRKAEAQRAEQERADAERARQLAADAARREEAEQAVRRAEARAKAQAREEAAADLAARAESEARTRQLIALNGSAPDGESHGDSDSGSGHDRASAPDGPDHDHSHSHSPHHRKVREPRRRKSATLADDLLGEGMDEPEPKSRRWRYKDDV